MTREQRNEIIIEMAQRGYAFREIGRQLGISAVQVGRITWPRLGKRSLEVFSQHQRDRAVDIVALGGTFVEAAEATGMTRSAVAGAVWRARMGKP